MGGSASYPQRSTHYGKIALVSAVPISFENNSFGVSPMGDSETGPAFQRPQNQAPTAGGQVASTRHSVPPGPRCSTGSQPPRPTSPLTSESPRARARALPPCWPDSCAVRASCLRGPPPAPPGSARGPRPPRCASAMCAPARVFHSARRGEEGAAGMIRLARGRAGGRRVTRPAPPRRPWPAPAGTSVACSTACSSPSTRPPRCSTSTRRTAARRSTSSRTVRRFRLAGRTGGGRLECWRAAWRRLAVGRPG